MGGLRALPNYIFRREYYACDKDVDIKIGLAAGIVRNLHQI